jgi:hypothetical protein
VEVEAKVGVPPIERKVRRRLLLRRATLRACWLIESSFSGTDVSLFSLASTILCRRKMSDR